MLYYNNHDISKSSHVQDSMKMYCENDEECRRSMLMNQFEQLPSFDCPKFLHLRCDVCMKLCKCLHCSDHETLRAVAACTNTFKGTCNLPSVPSMQCSVMYAYVHSVICSVQKPSRQVGLQDVCVSCQPTLNMCCLLNPLNRG